MSLWDFWKDPHARRYFGPLEKAGHAEHHIGWRLPTVLPKMRTLSPSVYRNSLEKYRMTCYVRVNRTFAKWWVLLNPGDWKLLPPVKTRKLVRQIEKIFSEQINNASWQRLLSPLQNFSPQKDIPVVLQLHYWPDFRPCDFFLFLNWKMSSKDLISVLWKRSTWLPKERTTSPSLICSICFL